MANVYVGFHEQRSCNRILKPPGGGTSNIFGGDSVPDVVPQNSPHRENKHQGSIKQIIQTDTVTSVTTKETTCSNGEIREQNVCKVEQNGGSPTKSQELVLKEAPLEIKQDVSPAPDVTAVVTSKVEQLKIEEKSSNMQISEIDSAGNTKIISSESNSEGSVKMNTSFKGSSIGDILKQDEAIEGKQKMKSPNQRVPPGGYSSGLW